MGYHLEPRWLEEVGAEDIVDNEHITALELRYDLTRGTGLYSEL